MIKEVRKFAQLLKQLHKDLSGMDKAVEGETLVYILQGPWTRAAGGCAVADQRILYAALLPEHSWPGHNAGSAVSFASTGF